MHRSLSPWRLKIVNVCAEVFGVGRIPPSGTMGTLVALPILWLLQQHFGQGGIWSFTVVISLWGIGIVNAYQHFHQNHDSREVVIDEVAGMSVCACFLPADIIAFALGFVMFRLFDIFKPYPIHLIDRFMRSGLGVMLDDLVAGVYAGLVSLGLWQFL